MNNGLLHEIRANSDTTAVLGATGFLGRAIIARLAASGQESWAFSRSGAHVDGAARNVALPPTPTPETFEGCDSVINCVGRVHVTRREKYDEAVPLYMAINHELAVAFALASRAAGVKRFVQISSVAAIRSQSFDGETIDDATTPSPATPYGISKLVADRALEDLSNPEFKIICLRPPAIYGPDVGAYFAMLEKFAARGMPLPLGKIENRRSFAFVDNVADAAIAAARSGLTGCFVVTDSAPISTAALYRQLLHIQGKPDRTWRWPGGVMKAAARVVLRGRADSLLGNAAYDGHRFAELSGWKPAVSMSQGLVATVTTR